MELIHDYFDRLVFLFEEENDVLDIKGKIKTPFTFIDSGPHLNTLLKDLDVNVGYLTDSNTMFCIRLKDKAGKNYFYDFYMDSSFSSPSTKLVFGVNRYGSKTLNKMSDEELRDIALKDIIGSHDAAVKISIPGEVTDNFFSAILQYCLDFGMFAKTVSFRGQLEADEIPFTNLSAIYSNKQINRQEIYKYLDSLQSYISNVFTSINNNIIKISQSEYSDQEDLIKKMRKFGVDITLDRNKLGLLLKDPSLKEYFLNFGKFHQTISTLHGRGGTSIEGLGSKFLDQKIKKMINFFDDLNKKIIFFKNELDKISDKDFNYSTFSAKLDKLRNALFHRNRLYRIFINKFFRIDEFIGKTDIINDDEIEINKEKVFNNLISSIKNKKIETTIKVYNSNSRKFEDKNFIYNLYSETLKNKIQKYFDEIKDDSLFSKENLSQTIKLIKKEVDEYLLDNMISMDKGWVTFNIVNKN
jgi:hypothetical protein